MPRDLSGIHRSSNPRETVHAISVLPPSHLHHCGCGAIYICNVIDGCGPAEWTCPACETQQLDDYMEAHRHELIQEPRS